jgi:hypothetical protein
MLVSRINRPPIGVAAGSLNSVNHPKKDELKKEKQHGSEKNGQGSQERQETRINQVVEQNTPENIVGGFSPASEQCRR